MPWATLGIAAGTGLINALSGSSERKKARRALRRYRQSLMDAKYDPVEKRKALDETGDTFNTQMNEFLNETTAGMATSGFLNPGTRRSVITGKLLGQRASALTGQSREIDQFNKNIDLQLAQSELNVPQGNVLEDLAVGGLSGAELGMNIKSLMKENELTDELIKKLKGTTGGNTGSTGAPYFNFFKRPVRR